MKKLVKTPDEIKKGLSCCAKEWAECEECTYCDGCFMRGGNENLDADALTYIAKLESRLAQVECEMDAAVRIVHGLCLHCKNEDSKDETCRECMYYPYRVVYGTGDTYVDNWQWRGVCAENTKEEK